MEHQKKRLLNELFRVWKANQALMNVLEYIDEGDYSHFITEQPMDLLADAFNYKAKDIIAVLAVNYMFYYADLVAYMESQVKWSCSAIKWIDDINNITAPYNGGH